MAKSWELATETWTKLPWGLRSHMRSILTQCPVYGRFPLKCASKLQMLGVPEYICFPKMSAQMKLLVRTLKPMVWGILYIIARNEEFHNT